MGQTTIRVDSNLPGSSLPSATVAQSYNITLLATGGTSPYTHVISEGILPPGLSLTSDGVVAGTPQVAGQFSFSVQSTDASSRIGVTPLNLRVSSQSGLGISNTTLPPANLGKPYDVTLTAQGGTPPYVWDAVLGGGALPAGLNLRSNGQFTGTPTSAGIYPFVARVLDANGNTFQSALTLRVDAANLTIFTNSLMGAFTNVPYTQQVLAIGGAQPYGFELVTGELPAGVTLASNGALSGTPTTAGTYNFTLRATDGFNATAEAPLSIVVTAGTLRIVSSSMTTGTMNQPFMGALVGQGGTPPYSFSVQTGSLPAGLTLSPNGTISGMATASGVFPVTIRLADSSGATTQSEVVFNVNSSGFSINSVSAAEGMLNSPYFLSLTTAEATSPVTFEVLSGTLPPGMSLNSNGTISGTPDTAGSYAFVVKATDAAGATAQLPLTIRIQASTFMLSMAGLANGQVGQPYSSTLMTSNGTGPYTFSVTSGNLPPGLTLGTNGNLSGTPTASGLWWAAIKAMDSSGQSAESTLPIYIGSTGLTLNPLYLPAARPNEAYNASLTASGGTAPYTFQVSSGALPAGLTLSSAGVLSGTPSQATAAPFTIRVTDASGATSVVTYALNLNSGSTMLTSTAPAAGQLGRAYTTTFTTSGGSGASMFSLAGGSLPPGLTLSSEGVVSGTPTAAGSYVFVLKTTDTANSTAQFTQSITISASQLAFAPFMISEITPGTPFTFTFTGTGGIAPYTFSLASGTLPTGMTLSPTGTLSGTTTESGSYPVTLRITDATGATATTTASLVVGPGASLKVTTTALPSAIPGQAYSTMIMASGGRGPYTFALGQGSMLPAGLTLSVSGLLSGVATTAGNSSIVIEARDATGATAQQTLALSVFSGGLSFSNDSLPNGRVGTAYTATLTPAGGSTPYTVSLAGGTLPQGITLSGEGALAGTPTTAGSYPVVVRLRDAAGLEFQKSYTIQITGASGLTFVNTSLPSSYVGQSYRAVLEATGGTAPYSFSIVGGSLPNGLVLATNGTISGTATGSGQSAVTFRVSDGSGGTAERMLTIGSSSSTIRFGFNSLPNGNVGQAYSFTPTGTGGSSPYTITAVGPLPAGLTLGANGILEGTPTQEGTFNILLRAVDASGAVVESNFPYTVVGSGFRFTSLTLPNAQNGQPYVRTIMTTGGTGAVTFTLTSGNMPAGLSLASNGIISGTPTASGTFPLTIRATDSAGGNATGNFTLTVSAFSIAFNSRFLPTGTVGQAYNQSLLAQGGTSPYAYTLSQGTLPPGLTLSGAGVISGTPTTVGTSTFTLRATDGAGLSNTAEFLIGVGAAGGSGIVAVVSSADYRNNGVVPGELILVYGTNLGPATLVSYTPSNNMVGTTLGGTRVLFDDTAAPVIYASANQVAVVAPFNLESKTSVRITVETNGVVSAATQLPVRQAKPGIFTQNASGSGPASLLNTNGSLNTAANPADQQSVISVLATGLGQTMPASMDGQIGTGAATVAFPISATVNGQPAVIESAGTTVGLIPGLAEIKLRLPAGTMSGSNAIQLTVAGAKSVENVTLFVK